MSRNNSHDQERYLISALERLMTMIIIDQLCAEITQHMTQPTVNNTQLIYAANKTNDYVEALDGVIVQHFSVAIVHAYFETTLFSHQSMCILYNKKVLLTHMTWRNLTV